MPEEQSHKTYNHTDISPTEGFPFKLQHLLMDIVRPITAVCDCPQGVFYLSVDRSSPWIVLPIGLKPLQ